MKPIFIMDLQEFQLLNDTMWKNTSCWKKEVLGKIMRGSLLECGVKKEQECFLENST